jgi:hypothetical protein
MSRSQTIRLAWSLTVILCASAGHSATVQSASELLVGTYRCSAYNVSGGGGSCRNMQPLVLKEDGSYQYSSTRGRWITYGGKLLLSDSQLWGPGEILDRDTVRFAYDYRDWRHVVTWICRECTVAAPDTDTTSSAYVGVSLTLEFAEPVGGVSGFVIVPADAARRYTHNAPLPEGAVQGVAWERGSTTVALATNRNNGLMSGRRYVVFLAWPRETLPVAILELPPLDRDFAATLSATLDGAAVLERLDVPADGSAETYPPASFVPSEPPPGYPAADAEMQIGPPADVPPEDPDGSSAGQPPGSGGRSALRDFVNTVNELGRAFEGLRQLGKKGRETDGGEAAPPMPPPSYPPASPYPDPDPTEAYPPSPAAYPESLPTPSDAFSAYPSDYSTYPPAPSEAPSPPQGYGTAPSWPAAEAPPAAPKCNPQIPKYSQPGCVE